MLLLIDDGVRILADLEVHGKICLDSATFVRNCGVHSSPGLCPSFLGNSFGLDFWDFGGLCRL